ncbi:restriction endonuclease [Roseivirga seohaensis]|uniref:Restriction endonuclease n=1 Tax=Roseivirga seohaensis TaxID=1914963 RepID=A0A150Y2E0_9BACT|nr:restriction endonuclease [Roseivirga seohaensis]
MVTCIGATIGKTGIIRKEGAFNQQINAIVPNKPLSSEFIYYQIISSSFQRAIKNAASSTTLPILNKGRFSKLIFRICPLPEQRAIVSKIEELFSDLDKGIADLKKAQDQLKIYRQAVLKKAFEGELTREWREQQTNLPTADQLLEQIKEERQKHYEQQLENWKQAVKDWEKNGKEGKKPGKPAIYKLFDSPVKTLNLNLPSTWFFDCIGNTCSKTEYGSSSKSNISGKIPVLRMGNMQDGKIDWKDLKYSSDSEEINQYLLKEGDVLFNRTNSPELVGKTVQYKGERPAIFAGYLIRLNQIENIISGAYLNHFLNSHPAKVYGSFVKTDGVNQSNINGDKLSNYPIPICSIEEQHQIVREIETRLSVCDKVEQSITESLEKAKALRQSILKKAFEGTLLSTAEIEKCKQAKDYEPASVLLERIKNSSTKVSAS